MQSLNNLWPVFDLTLVNGVFQSVTGIFDSIFFLLSHRSIFQCR